MATKAAKSITINATKYELANALAVNGSKIQLKAKDVVLDEVTPPSAESYVRFVADGTQKDGGTIPATAITIEKSADITNMTWAQFVEKVRTGTKVSLKIITQHANFDKAYIVEDPTIIDGVTNFDQACVRFQFTGINRVDGYWTPLIYTGAKSFYFDYYFRVPRTSVIDWDNFGDDEGKPSLYIDEVEVPEGSTVVNAKLTSDMSLAQVGKNAGWRAISFTGVTFNDVISLLAANKVVYIALKGSTNQLTAFAPLTLTRTFTGDVWGSGLSFIADSSIFDINNTPAVKRMTTVS